jgi:hypothetical protein
MKKVILLFFSLIALFSCNNSNKKNERPAYIEHIAKTITNSGFMEQIPSELVEIDADNCIKLKYDSELDDKITDIRYIYLKTEEPIGYINKVMVHKNKIYVVDWMISHKVFIFDMEGNLINIISDQGPGPKEYTSLGYADICNDELIIADRRKAKRIYYTLEGKYIRQEKSLPCIEFAMLGDKFILQLGYPQSFDFNTTPILVVSVKDSALRRALPYQNIQKVTTHGFFSYNYMGDLLFTPTVSDTIYHILTDSTFTAKYFVNHKKSIWQLYKENLVHDEISQKIRDGYSRFGNFFYETEKNIHFSISFSSEQTNYILSNHYWYDKESKKTYAKGSISHSEQNVITNFFPITVGVCGNYYIGEIRPETIEMFREHYQQAKGTKDSLYFKNEELRKIIEAEDDPNQVLVLYQIDFNK